MDPVASALGVFGREDALRVVGDLLRRGGSAVTVGDPGAGKSSLLRVVAQAAQRQGRRVLSVAPTQFEQGLPFAGLAELIRQCPEGAEKELPHPQQRALAVALQHTDNDGHDIDTLAVPLAVSGLLRGMCEIEPVTLLLDDLQWLDQASIGTLGFAVRGVPAGLSVLVATRPDPAAGIDLLRSLPEPRHEFVLGPLDEHAVGQLLRTRLGPRWTPPLVARVAEVSGGNPLLALEIARAMQDGLPRQSGPARYGADPVAPMPFSLADLLRERVTRLPTEAREVLLLVSAAGRLTLAQVQAIIAEPRLSSALEAAADAEVAGVGIESVIAFTHPLLASAIYDAAGPAERRRAHRVLAESLEDPVERARHRARSIIAPEEAVAAELERAALVSRARGAQQLAGELLESAAMATPAGPGTSAGFRRWLSAVDAYSNAGDGMAAHAALGKAAALAAAAEQQAEVLVRKAQLAEGYRDGRALLEQAFRLLPAGSDVRIQILPMLAEYRRMEGHGPLAKRLADIAVRAAAHRPNLQLIALNRLRTTEQIWDLGDHHQTWRDIEHLVATSAAKLDVSDVVWARGFYATWNDREAESVIRDGIASITEAGRYGYLAPLYMSLVLFLIRASRVRDAQAALAEADRSGAWGTAPLQPKMARALVMEYAGDLDEARTWVRSAAQSSPADGWPYWRGGFLAQLGFIEVSARNWPAALDALRDLAAIFATTKMVDLEQLLWPIDYADAALQVGSLGEVETAIGLLRRQAAAGRREAGFAADRCSALLTAVRGDPDTAIRVLRGIVEQRGGECPFEAARSQLALGQVYRRAGLKAAAHQTLHAAADAFDEVGVPRWVERARDEAARIGPHSSSGVLTETERRVAELVGAGRTNQEAAAELFMSAKTIEAHLTRIYRKLSVRSRTELAGHMNAQAAERAPRD